MKWGRGKTSFSKGVKLVRQQKERTIIVGESQIMEEIRIKLNNVRFILIIFQNIQIGDRQVRNVEYLTNTFTSLDREDCKRETRFC